MHISIYSSRESVITLFNIPNLANYNNALEKKKTPNAQGVKRKAEKPAEKSSAKKKKVHVESRNESQGSDEASADDEDNAETNAPRNAHESTHVLDRTRPPDAAPADASTANHGVDQGAETEAVSGAGRENEEDEEGEAENNEIDEGHEVEENNANEIVEENNENDEGEENGYRRPAPVYYNIDGVSGDLLNVVDDPAWNVVLAVDKYLAIDNSTANHGVDQAAETEAVSGAGCDNEEDEEGEAENNANDEVAEIGYRRSVPIYYDMDVVSGDLSIINHEGVSGDLSNVFDDPAWNNNLLLAHNLQVRIKKFGEFN